MCVNPFCRAAKKNLSIFRRLLVAVMKMNRTKLHRRLFQIGIMITLKLQIK